MGPWTGAIIEWLNCLGVRHPPLLPLPVHAEAYQAILSQLPPPTPSVSAFLSTEYPDFVESSSEAPLDPLHIPSLLLLATSQNPVFHPRMCALHHDTQILIKRFLEALLPHGTSVTHCLLTSTISELCDATPQTPPRTPQMRPLRMFLASPAAQSAKQSRILNEKSREIIKLRAEIETERYEKLDLQENLKTKEDKVNQLQERLQGLQRELKALKARPATPKPKKKGNQKGDESGSQELLLRKEIESLEDYNSTLQRQLETLEVEKEELGRRLGSKERFEQSLKEKVEGHERNLDSLAGQLEQKSSELLEMKFQNEELRVLLKDMQRCSLEIDQSFDGSLRRPSTPGFNTSEALSSVIDIQLQEAREDTQKLRTELASLETQLQNTLQKTHELEEKNAQLILVEASLKTAELEILKKTEQIQNLENSKESLQKNLEILGKNVTEKEEKLEDLEKSCKGLELKLENQGIFVEKLKEKIKEIKCSLSKRNDEYTKICDEKEGLKRDFDSSQKEIVQLQASLKLEIERSSEISRAAEENSETLGEKIGVLTRENSKLEDIIKEKELSLENCSQKLENKRLVIDSLNILVEDLTNSKNTQEITIKDLDMKLCELHELREELQSQLTEKHTNLLQVSSENEELQKKLQVGERERGKLEENIDKLDLELGKMQENSEELEKQRKTTEEKLEKSTENVRLLKLEVEGLNSEISRGISEVSKLQEFQENLENQLRQQQENSMKLITERGNLEHEVSKKNLEISDATKRIVELEGQLNRSLQELQDLENVQRDLEEGLEKEKTQVRVLEAQLVKGQQDLQKSNSETSEQKSIVTRLGAELKALNLENSRLQKAFSKLEDENRKLTDQLGDSNLKNTEMYGKIQEMTTKIKELDALAEQNRTEKGEKELGIQDLSEKLNIMTSERDSLDKSLEILSERTTLEISDLKLTQDKLNSQLEKTREHLKIVEDEKTGINSELSDVREEKMNLEKHLQDLQQQLCKSEQKIESLSSEISKLSSELRQSSLNRENLENELENLSECTTLEISELRSTKKLLEEQLTSERETNRVISLEKSSLIDQLSILQVSNADFCEKLKFRDEQLSVSEKKVESLQNFSRELTQKCQKLTEQIDLLTSEGQNLSSRLEKTISQKDFFQNTSMELENQTRDLNCRLDGLVAEKSNLISELAKLKHENEVGLEKLRGKDDQLCESKEKIEELEKFSQTLTKKCEKLNEQIDLLTSEGKTLTSNLEKSISERDVLQDFLTTLESQVADLKSQLQDLSGANLSLTSDLSNVRQANDDLLSELTLKGEKLKESDEKIEEITNHSQRLQQTIDESTARIISLTSEVENLESKLEGTIAEGQSALEDLKSQLSAEKQSNEVLSTEKSVLSTELSAQKTQNERLMSDLRSKDEKLKECDEKIEELTSHSQQLQQEIDESTERIISVTSEVKNLESKLEGTIAEGQAALEDLKSQLSTEKQSNEVLSTEKSRLSTELSAQKTQNESLMSDLRSKDEKLKECDGKIEEITIHSQHLQQKIDESTERITSLTSEVKNLESKLEGTFAEGQSALEDLKSQLSAEKQSNELLSTEKSLLSTELSAQKSQNAEVTRRLESEQDKLRHLEENEKESNEKIALLTSEIRALALNAETLMSTQNSLKSDLKNLEVRLSDSENELKSERNFNDTLKSERSLLASELCESRAEIEKTLKRSAEKFQNLTSEFESLSLNHRQTLSDYESLQNDLEEVQKQFENSQILFKTQTQEINDLKVALKESEVREISSAELITSLKNSLISAETAQETLKAEQHKKEETIELLNSKLEESKKEQIDSDAKMKEIIQNLQEIRGTQDAVMKSQSIALDQRNSDFESLEKTHLSMKKSLEEAILLEKSKNTDLINEIEGTKQCFENSLRRIEGFVEKLKLEEEKSGALTEHLEKISQEKGKILEISKILISDLSKLAKIVSSEVHVPKGEIGENEGNFYLENLDLENFSVTLENLEKSSKLLGESLVSVVEDKQKLLAHLDAEKLRSAEEKIKIQELSEIMSLLESSQDRLRGLLETLIASRDDLEKTFVDVNSSWGKILLEKSAIFNGSASACDEVKHLEAKYSEIEKLIKSVGLKKSESFQPIMKSLSRAFRWSNNRIQAGKSYSTISSGTFVPENVKIENVGKEELQNGVMDLRAEEDLIEAEIKKNENILEEMQRILEEIGAFERLVKSHEDNLKSGVIKREPTPEEKLQTQVERLAKEKKEMKEKLDAMRVRSAKMEKNMDDLRGENKKLKGEMVPEKSEKIDELKNELVNLDKVNQDLTSKLAGLKIENEDLKIRNEELKGNQCVKIENDNTKLPIDKFKKENEDLMIKAEESSMKREQAINEELLKKNEDLTQRIQELKSVNFDLRREIEELKKSKDGAHDFDAKLKEVHHEYGLKLEKIKQKMKAAYNEQAGKMQMEQDRIIREKTVEMQEKMKMECRKYVEDLDKYKAHVKEMSSQYWNVGEKLLAEKQEKEVALGRLREMQKRHQSAVAEASQRELELSRMRSASLDRGHERVDLGLRSGYRTVQVIEEQTTRRHSVKSIQAMGNAFRAEDEDEIFDNVYLADLKDGQFRAIEPQTDFDRLSELRMRNSLCRPHLRSSYAVETHLHTLPLSEEDIKSGPHDDIFNDSLSQSLLPGQKVKKRDRTQSNELKSPVSRILEEKNVDRRTTATPKRLKDLFGTSLSRRHDENVAGTPKGRRLSNIFRKPKTDRS